LANKLGGVHYDLARNQSEAHVEEIQNQFAILYEHEKRNIQVVSPAEIQKFRADPNLRRNLYDAIQLSVGDTAAIFCSGIRAAEKELRALLT
jgi:replication initiation and membrane attachment protein DnaB